MKNKLLIALLSWLSLGLVSTAVAQTTGFKLGSSPGTKEANAILDLGQGNRGLLKGKRPEGIKCPIWKGASRVFSKDQVRIKILICRK